MIGLEYILHVFDVSNTELADKLGIKRQNITCWFNGKQAVSKKHLPQLAKIFKLPECYFQKELSEIEKLDVQIKQLDQFIDDSYESYEEEEWDEETQEFIFIEKEQYDEEAENLLESLEAKKLQLELMQMIGQSIDKEAQTLKDSDPYLMYLHRQAKITLYESIVNIIDSTNNYETSLLNKFIKALELFNKDCAHDIDDKSKSDSLADIKSDDPFINEMVLLIKKYN